MITTATHCILTYLSQDQLFQEYLTTLLLPTAIHEAWDHELSYTFWTDMCFYQSQVVRCLIPHIKAYINNQIKGSHNALVQILIEDAIQNASFYIIARQSVSLELLREYIHGQSFQPLSANNTPHIADTQNC